ncbi:MAG: pirin family protein, partial [Bacteroidetes bacterium]|nr:pirin family protein [Bacteroidota bacterium]
MSTSSILDIAPLGFQWPTSDPFLFCVHHDDAYPKGDGHFGPDASLEGRDLGQDFDNRNAWRMYH